MKRLAAVAIAAAPLVSSAQSVVHVQYRASATMLAAQGEATSCGIAFVGASDFDQNAVGIAVIDGSLAVHDSFISAVKAGLIRTTGRRLRDPAQKLLPATGQKVMWVRFAATKAVAPKGPMIATEDSPGFFLYAGDMVEGLVALDTVLDGQPQVRIAFADPGKGGRYTIYSGPLHVSAETRSELSSCLADLLPRLKAIAEKSVAKRD